MIDDRDAEADRFGDEEPRRVRLNKYLADHGVASRRRCDELIAAGKVSVDDQIVTELGLKVDPDRQRVEIDGVVLKPETARHKYYLLHKPKGVLCTNERREARPRAIDLITDPDKGRIYTVGRLDEESTGLILLTNDGEFANRVAHPRYGVTKTYLVKVRGRIDGEAIERVKNGVRLSEGRTSPAFVKVLKRANDFSLLTVTLNEGKNREVRRVFAAVGYKVLQLRRTHIGTLSDRSLRDGEWRPLLRAEVQELLSQSSTEAAAAPVADRREDPRARFFARGPGPERRGPKSGERWRRDRKRSLERMQPREERGAGLSRRDELGRRGRGERREKLRKVGKHARKEGRK
jgi:23S rRNA pseudouridine2605 synthase